MRISYRSQNNVLIINDGDDETICYVLTIESDVVIHFSAEYQPIVDRIDFFRRILTESYCLKILNELIPNSYLDTEKNNNPFYDKSYQLD